MNIFTEIGILRKQIQVIYDFITTQGEQKMFNVENLQAEVDSLTALVAKAKTIIGSQANTIADQANTIAKHKSDVEQHQAELLAAEDVNNKANVLTSNVHDKLSELEAFLNATVGANTVVAPVITTNTIVAPIPVVEVVNTSEATAPVIEVSNTVVETPVVAAPVVDPISPPQTNTEFVHPQIA